MKDIERRLDSIEEIIDDHKNYLLKHMKSTLEKQRDKNEACIKISEIAEKYAGIIIEQGELYSEAFPKLLQAMQIMTEKIDLYESED